jgi:hypothetical protein
MSSTKQTNQTLVIEALGEEPKPYMSNCELVHATGLEPAMLEEAIKLLELEEKVGCRFVDGGMMAWLAEYA